MSEVSPKNSAARIEIEAADATGSPVMDAFRRLCTLAATGRSYARQEVFRDTREDLAADAPVGTGYTLTRTIQIPDNGTVSLVPATAEIRILHLTYLEPEGTLCLQVHLRWQPTNGMRHSAFAKYDIDDTAAVMLAGELVRPFAFSVDPEAVERGDITLTPELKELLAQEFATYTAKQALYDPEWILEIEGDGLQQIEAARAYHSVVIEAAKQAEPLLLGMLSDSDSGHVDPQELIDILTWCRMQPELAGKL